MSVIMKTQTKRKPATTRRTTARAVKETTATYAARNGAGRKPAVKRREIGAHLVIDPEICHGELTFKGTRVPVETVLTFLAMGYSIAELLRNYPQLSRTAVVKRSSWQRMRCLGATTPRVGRSREPNRTRRAID